jgi:asparagine synthase (glutamine-hydrolysing)
MSGTPLSNTDNMALVGVLSTQLVHHHYVAGRPRPAETVHFRTDVDRTESGKAA